MSKWKLEPARYAIVGSRDFPRLDIVRRFVEKLPAGSVVISGAARGVDSTSEDAARARGLEVVSYPADWSQGKSAGMVRNGAVVLDADIVVAFWDGSSRGTQNTMKRTLAAKKPLFVCNRSGVWELS